MLLIEVDQDKIKIQVRPTNLAPFLRAHISINKACNPIILENLKALDLCFPVMSLDLRFGLKLSEICKET